MLRSELRALRNTFRTKEGRQALLGTSIVLVCLLVGGGTLGSMLTTSAWLEQVGLPEVVGALAAALASFAALLVFAFAKIPCRNQLLLGSHVPAWLASPAGCGRIVTWVWLRQASGAWLATIAVAFVPMAAVVLRAELPLAVLFAYLLQLVLVVGAAVAAVLLSVLLGARFASGGRLRQVLMIAHFGFVLAFVVLMLSGIGGGEQLRSWLADWQAGGNVLLDGMLALGRLPEAAARSTVDASAWLPSAVLVALAIALLLLAKSLYRSAFETWLCATPSGRVTQARGRWPRTAVPSLVRRGFVEAWRSRGSLVLVSLFGAFAVWRPASRPFVAQPTDALPIVSEVFFLQSGWLPLNAVLAMLVFLGVVGDEQKQLPLLATSPLDRRDLLRSRVMLVGWPFALTIAMTALSGALVGGVGLAGATMFVLVALPCAGILLGSCLAVGSWPAFIAVRSDVPLASNVRSVVPVLVLSAVTGALLSVQDAVRRALLLPADGATTSGHVAWWWLWLLAAWAAGAVVFATTCAIARRNLAALLGPQA